MSGYCYTRIEPETGLPWPCRYIVDEQGRDTGFGAIRGFLGGKALEFFEEWKVGRPLVGWAHFGTFPMPSEVYGGLNGTNWRYETDQCDLWCHCFREPDRFLPPGVPRLLLSGSDFVDTDRLAPLVGTPKRYDLLYSCLDNWFNAYQKNLDLYRRCLGVLDRNFDHLTVKFTGRPQVPWSQHMRMIAASRAVFIPSISDASPRLITEALALDVPVLVNRHILGGWKYVNAETGRFFTDETDVVESLVKLYEADLHPRRWLVENYGRPIAGWWLAQALRELGAPDSLRFAEPADALR